MSELQGESFETLVRPHMPALFRSAFRLTGHRLDAEDLVQDTCIVASGRLSELGACAAPDRWLMRVLYNRFIDLARRHGRSPIVSLNTHGDTDAFASDEPGPEELFAREDDEGSLYRAWLELEPPQRALLALRAEGFDLGEIEEITGIGRDVLPPRLYRARQSLRRHLEKESDEAGRLARLGSQT